MSAAAAAAALGYTGAEGKTTGILFSALAAATLARMGVSAAGLLNDPSFAPVLPWIPVACWAVAGAMLVAASLMAARRLRSLQVREQ
jgi:hypothetical protein